MEYLRREIEVNEKLLRLANVYGFTENDIMDISSNLAKYKKAWIEAGYDEQ